MDVFNSAYSTVNDWTNKIYNEFPTLPTSVKGVPLQTYIFMGITTVTLAAVTIHEMASDDGPISSDDSSSKSDSSDSEESSNPISGFASKLMSPSSALPFQSSSEKTGGQAKNKSKSKTKTNKKRSHK